MDGLDTRRRAQEEAWVRAEERKVRLRVSRDTHFANAVAARIGMSPADAGTLAASFKGWRPTDGTPRDAGLVALGRRTLADAGVAATDAETAAMLREAEAAAAREDRA